MQAAPVMPGGWGYCVRLPGDNARAFFIFKALPVPTFILASPQPAWEVSAIDTPSRSPGGARTRPSSAALCRSKGGLHGRHSAGCGTEGNPAGWGSAGTCRTHSPPPPGPPGPALARCSTAPSAPAGTQLLGTARAC